MRQHPLVILLENLRFLKNLTISTFFIALFGSGGRLQSLQSLIYLSLLAGLGLGLLILRSISGFAKWYFYTYQITDAGTFTIKYGVLTKHTRELQPDQIKAITSESGPIHRIFATESLKIETAGDGDEESSVHLKAIDKEEAHRIKQLISQTASTNYTDISDIGVYTPSLKHLVIYAATSTKLQWGVPPLLILFQRTSPEMRRQWFSLVTENYYSLSWVSTLLFACGLIILLQFFTALIIFVFSWQYKIERKDNSLFVSYGFFVKKKEALPVDQIRSLLIEENLLRQPFGLCSVSALVAQGTHRKGKDNVLIAPVIKVSEVRNLLDSLRIDYPSTFSFCSLPKRSQKKYITLYSIWGFLISAGALIIYTGDINTPFRSIEICMLVGVLLGYIGLIHWRYTGYSLGTHHFTLRQGGYNLRTQVTLNKYVEAIEIQRNIFQRRGSLTNISIWVNCLRKKDSIRHVSQTQSQNILSWFSSSADEKRIHREISMNV